MHGRKRRRWIAAGALLAALAPGARARACVTEGQAVAFGVGALLVPSDIGVAVPTANPSVANLVLGWSWQLPLLGVDAPSTRHRIAGGVDVLPHSNGASWRGRLGYRYGRHHVFAGAGVGADGAGVNLSPEIGLKFMNDDDGSDHSIDPSLHLLARAEIAPESGHVRGATVLLGWNLF
jgi:hypothetical protein